MNGQECKNMNPETGNGTIGGLAYAHDKVGRPMAAKTNKIKRVFLDLDEDTRQKFEVYASEHERTVPGQLRIMIKRALALEKTGRILSDADLQAIFTTVVAAQTAIKSDKIE
jgi:glutamate synthase domain-containing protein 3